MPCFHSTHVVTFEILSTFTICLNKVIILWNLAIHFSYCVSQTFWLKVWVKIKIHFYSIFDGKHSEISILYLGYFNKVVHFMYWFNCAIDPSSHVQYLNCTLFHFFLETNKDNLKISNRKKIYNRKQFVFGVHYIYTQLSAPQQFKAIKRMKKQWQKKSLNLRW